MKNNTRTYIRTFNSTVVDKIFIVGLFKKIVNFYCDTTSFNRNIFKNSHNMPINYTEHKMNLDFMKVSKNSDINC